MRLTTRTNLAMRTLMYCAVNTGRNIRTSEIAEATNASENHLGQVINTLGQTGFIKTVRGRGGGIRLGREPGVVGECFGRQPQRAAPREGLREDPPQRNLPAGTDPLSAQMDDPVADESD